MTTVGRSLQRIDALGKVTGETLYPGDIYLPGMLSMKILFAGRPHAIVRRLDTERAKRMPGVVAVLRRIFKTELARLEKATDPHPAAESRQT